ncbi:hypothetical protein EON81_20350, partial [bacterium]
GEVGSGEVVMTPGSPVQSGRYEFNIGTAGSTSLVLQTILVPLLLTGEESGAKIVGGTHNPLAPSSDYLRTTYLRAAELSDHLGLDVERVGFFPRGGGRISVAFRPRPLSPISTVERGERELLTATVTVSDSLPVHILDRARTEIEGRAQKSGWPLQIVLARVPTDSPGVAIHLDAHYSGGVAGFTGLGRKGLPTERVVAEAWAELEAFEATDAAVDEHLADQLLLSMLFADGPSEYVTNRVTEHLRTMAWLVSQFGVGSVAIDEETGRVRVTPGG